MSNSVACGSEHSLLSSCSQTCSSTLTMFSGRLFVLFGPTPLMTPLTLIARNGCGNATETTPWNSVDERGVVR